MKRENSKEKQIKRIKILVEKYKNNQLTDYLIYAFTIFNEVMSDSFFEKTLKDFDKIKEEE